MGSTNKKIFKDKKSFNAAILSEDKKIQTAEAKIERLKRMLEEREQTRKTSSSKKKSSVKSKPKAKKPAPRKDNTPAKKHEKVASSYLSVYNYKKKLAIWKKSAGDNLTTQGCDKCHGKEFHKTILLDNGKHVCWFCWIRKPDDIRTVRSKKSSRAKKN